MMKQNWYIKSAITSMLAVPLVLSGQHVEYNLATVASVAMSQTEKTRNVLETKVTLDLRDVSLKQALDEIIRRSGVTVMYSPSLIPADRRVSVMGTLALRDALRQVLQHTGTEARIADAGRVVVARTSATLETQQSGTVMGKVVNAKTKQPVVGARITIDGSSVSASTGADGTFRLAVSAGEHVIQVRAVGFVRQGKPVAVKTDETVTVEVVLDPSASVLDEVVVTGTVVATERKSITTPITVITAEDIEKRGITRLEQLMRGEIPGVVAREIGVGAYTPNLGGSTASQVYARGSASLDGVENPLKTYVDGVEVDPTQLGMIDPTSIERIEVITGPQAATVYGSGAMGGVMQIFTKRGRGALATDITLGIKYGMLQSNLSDSRTPSHTQTINVVGGSGPDFSYSGTLSHKYTGQWQPDLFARSIAGSLGVTYTKGRLTAAGSVSSSFGKNGTSGSQGAGYSGWNMTSSWLLYSVAAGKLYQDGEAPISLAGSLRSPRISEVTAQTISLSVDIRQSPMWQQHLTIGKNTSNLALEPVAPVLLRPSDSLFTVEGSIRARNTASYNTTLVNRTDVLSSTITVGGNGAWGGSTSFHACKSSLASTSLEGCFESWSGARLSQSVSNDSWGGFASGQFGILDQLYFSLGLRGEANEGYGKEHTVDWTPTVGATYTLDVGPLSVKVLGSYGRATRPPDPSYRDAVVSTNVNYEPVQRVSRLANPMLRPERSRGPQGGIELYYGNLGSLTINRYRQTIDDLLMLVVVDSVELIRVLTGEPALLARSQYANVATMRQQGWESTGNLNLGAFSLKATYSWSDSRVAKIPANSRYSYSIGNTFRYVPTHSGNLTLGYAYRNTTVTVVTNYTGSSIVQGGRSSLRQVLWGTGYSRLDMYSERALGWQLSPLEDRIPGYVKSDVIASHRINPWATVTLNVVNATNDIHSDLGGLFPTLGRQTIIGLSLRNVKR